MEIPAQPSFFLSSDDAIIGKNSCRENPGLHWSASRRDAQREIREASPATARKRTATAGTLVRPHHETNGAQSVHRPAACARRARHEIACGEKCFKSRERYLRVPNARTSRVGCSALRLGPLASFDSAQEAPSNVEGLRAFSLTGLAMSEPAVGRLATAGESN